MGMISSRRGLFSFVVLAFVLWTSSVPASSSSAPDIVRYRDSSNSDTGRRDFTLVQFEIVGPVREALGDLAETISEFDVSCFVAPNDNAKKERRKAMSDEVKAVSKTLAANHIQGAISQLTSLVARLDGEPNPEDWMDPSEKKERVREGLEGVIAMLKSLK